MQPEKDTPVSPTAESVVPIDELSQARARKRKGAGPADPLKPAAAVLGVVAILGGFAWAIFTWVDHRASKGEAEIAAVRGEVEATRQDLRGVYMYLLSGQRQPRLERAVTEDKP